MIRLRQAFALMILVISGCATPRDPSLSMQFDSSFRYIGGPRFRAFT